MQRNASKMSDIQKANIGIVISLLMATFLITLFVNCSPVKEVSVTEISILKSELTEMNVELCKLYSSQSANVVVPKAEMLSIGRRKLAEKIEEYNHRIHDCTGCSDTESLSTRDFPCYEGPK